MVTDEEILVVRETPLTLMLKLPDGCTPGRLEAADAFGEIIAEASNRYPGRTFQLLPFNYDACRDGPALSAVLAVNVDGLSQGSAYVEELEPLRISPQCKAKYAGEFLKPAQLTERDVNEILDRLPLGAARSLRTLLVENGNRPTALIGIGHRPKIHHLLSEPVGGRYFRLASGTSRPGRYMSQLWEVRPAP